MFRIHFDPLLGRFIIQVKTGLFWRTVMGLSESKDKQSILMFESYDDAIEHVKVIGLNKLYRDGSRNKFEAFVNKLSEVESAIEYAALTGVQRA